MIGRELKGGVDFGLTSRANLLARSRHANNNRLSPPLMTSLERRPHNMHIPRAIERIIASTIRHLNQLLLNRLVAQLRRVYEIRCAELLRPLLLRIVDVHNDDFGGPVFDGALDDAETDAPGAEDGDVGALLEAAFACGDDGGAVPGRDAAAEEAGAVHGGLVGDGDDGDVGYDGVLREGGGAHEVEQVFAFAFEARGTVGHDAFALGGADLAAEIRLAGFAEFAFAAFGCAVSVSQLLLVVKPPVDFGYSCPRMSLGKHTIAQRHCLRASRS